MDLWVVAAAAGAGYIAKANYLNNPSRVKDVSLDSLSCDCVFGQPQSWNLLQWIRHGTCPLCRLTGRKQIATDASLYRDVTRVAIISGTYKSEAQLQSFGNYGRGHNLDTAKESLPDCIKGEVGSLQSVAKSRSLRSWSCGYILKDLYALDRCMVIDEKYEHPSITSPGLRNLLTDRDRIIRDGQDMDLETQVESMVFIRKPKKSTGTGKSRKLSFSQGSLNEMILFFLGTIIGIMSSVVATKREVDNLNELLKRNENFLQDLNEELQMKDQFSVKELANESSKIPEMNDESFLIYVKDPDDGQSKNSEEMIKIKTELEAELEAELERLEDLNRENEATLRNLGIANEQPDISTDSDPDANRYYDNHTGTMNYAVSAKDLSLRLHEVIQSRLEARIIELEAALENSQQKLQVLESDCIIKPQQGLYNEAES